MKELPDGYRVLVPPDTIPNSEVKRYIADGSEGPPLVRVGHRQALFFSILKKIDVIYLLLIIYKY